MDYLEIWNDICFGVNKYVFKNEDKLQALIEDSVLPSLNWKESRGEVERPTIHFGSAHKGIPDAVLVKDGKQVLVIELKRPSVPFKDINEEQLFSYMNTLKLKFGILIGEKIRVYYDNIIDMEPPKLIQTIDFTPDDKNGIKLVEQLYKNNFSDQNFEQYCKGLIKSNENEKKVQEDISYLCSDSGLEYIKDLLRIEYSNEVVDGLNISITRKGKQRPVNNFVENKFNDVVIELVSGEDYQKRNKESVQDWYKRILKMLYSQNRLTEDVIEKLHTKNYAQNNFNINYPILCDTNAQRYSADGRARYYTDKDMVGDKYYICSQLCNTVHYEKSIARWLNKILEINKKQ